MLMVLMSLPLTSAYPRPPNPVRLEFDEKPIIKSGLNLGETVTTLESVGVTEDFLLNLTGRSAFMYPKTEGSADLLKATLHSAFQQIGIRLPLEDSAPEIGIISASKLAKAVRSGAVRSYLPQRTKLYTIGPSLSTLPSQWLLQPIWQTGGLVTFSPTFILRSPERFGDIMRTIRASTSWAAYILPSLVEWASLSWTESA